MRLHGNIRSNLKYNPVLRSNPVPTDGDEGERASQMARYITRKYRDKAFMEQKPKVSITDRRSAAPALQNISGSIVMPQSTVAVAERTLAVPAQTREPLSRSATAPLPQLPPPHGPVQLGNPYARHMTASVQPSISNTPGQQAFTSAYNGNLPSQTNAAWHPQSYGRAQTLAQPSSSAFGSIHMTGGVWDDLAGLSLSHAAPAYAVPQSSSNQHFTGIPAISAHNTVLRPGPAAHAFSSQAIHSYPSSASQQLHPTLYSAPVPVSSNSRNPFFASVQQQQPFLAQTQFNPGLVAHTPGFTSQQFSQQYQ